MKRISVASYLVLPAALLLLTPGILRAHLEEDALIDIRDFAAHADFIFKGTVIDLNYRNSEVAVTQDPATGLSTTDGSDIPHTFITYQVEQVFKGRMPTTGPGGPPQSEFTLRMIGGKSDKPDPNITDDLGQPLITEFFHVATFPFFDIGDRDLLFVERNTLKSLPLTAFEFGRFRIINEDPNNPLSLPHIFSEDGMEIVHVPGEHTGDLGEATLGPHHDLPQAQSVNIGGMILELSAIHPPNEFDTPPSDPNVDSVPEPQIVPGTHFTEAQFDQFVADIVAEVCGSIPADQCGIQAVSADIAQPFIAAASFDEPIRPGHEPENEPNAIVEMPRPWLDELTPEQRAAVLEQEREEEMFFALSDENPVLPETPCDLQLLTDGPLPGDISGPTGRPDCRVDLFDFRVIWTHWLECNDPSIIECFL